MLIEILCTGDEILTGKTVNTNHSHIARRLGEVGLTVEWATTVGDDRSNLAEAFRLAAARADAVIVNGGLGPTIDDLSQEVAANAADVPLVLHEAWFDRMQDFYNRRGRAMPVNNKKQAMLPATAEFIDNPVGTACGFALDIGRARFFFTPGVPREMRLMIHEQVIPRLLAMSGRSVVTSLKRFHSFGIGESRADQMLDGIEALAPGGGVKLGFQAHYPQLETKLAAEADSEPELAAKLDPVVAAVRERLGNFIVAEDSDTLEGVVVQALLNRNGSLATAETVTGGAIAARFASRNGDNGDNAPFRRGVVAGDLEQLYAAVGLPADRSVCHDGDSAVRSVAAALRLQTGTSHALTALVQLDDGADRIEFGGTVHIGLADATGTVVRHARLLGGREWVRLGTTDLAIDCLRRHLRNLPVDERIDFEKR